MSGYDVFAWIVLVILVASAMGVFCIAGWLPGQHLKPTHMVRRVLLRQVAIINYVNPF